MKMALEPVKYHLVARIPWTSGVLEVKGPGMFNKTRAWALDSEELGEKGERKSGQA